MKIALSQFNASVGDITGNIEQMCSLIKKSHSLGVDLLVFPEMSVCGYPPEDLLLKDNFLSDNRTAVEKLSTCFNDITVIVGFAELDGQDRFNSLAVLSDGHIQKIYRKRILPNYGVFDERRYFKSGDKPVVINIGGINIVLTICEDIWELQSLEEFLCGVESKDVILNISASPFHVGKIQLRRNIVGKCARQFESAVAYCNLIGGQDELVFDGRSMFSDPSGDIICQAKAFEEDLLIADIELDSEGNVQIKNANVNPDLFEYEMKPEQETYEALVLGTRDYIRKNGFKNVIIGLSGGIDSSLTAAVAVDALGSENVVGITMPSRFNSTETITDAEKLALNLGIKFETLPIGDILDSFSKILGIMDGWSEDGLAYENLQARIRGTILMSLSNQFSYIVLTTGNKSETAVGYSTLYGDTAGGFAVIKDVPKTMVYKLSEYVNKIHNSEIIPKSVIERIPSAELRDDQKDTDSLPDYDLLDNILKGYIEENKSFEQLTDEALPPDVVNRVIRMVDRNEYKRRQCPPGIKITPRAFGRDRRMPITNRYLGVD